MGFLSETHSKEVLNTARCLSSTQIYKHPMKYNSGDAQHTFLPSQIDLSSFMPILGQHYKMLSADSIRIFPELLLPKAAAKKGDYI